MPTEKPRKTITIPDNKLEQVERYQLNKGYKSLTQAILCLIDQGLDASEPKDPSGELSGRALQMAADYDRLDFHGQRATRRSMDTELERVREQQLELPLVSTIAARGYHGEPLDPSTLGTIYAEETIESDVDI